MSSAEAVQETRHARIRFARDSFAERDMAAIGSRLESAYGILSDLLGIEIDGRIDVFLSELMVQYQGYRLVAGGYALPDRLQIHDVYRSDSPGESLERSLATIFLARVTGNEEPSPFLVDGVLGVMMQRLGTPFSPEALSEAKTQGELPPIAALLSGPTPENREIYYPAAAGFVDFLIRTRGAAGLRDLDSAGSSNVPAGTEKAWRKTIKVNPAGGVLRFLKASSVYLRPYRLKVAEIVAYVTLGVVFTIILTLVPGWLVDVLQGRSVHIVNQTVNSPWPLIVALAVAFVVYSILSSRQAYVTAYVSASILKGLRLRAFAVLQRLHPGYFQSNGSGDTISRMTNDMSMVGNAFAGPVTQTLEGTLTVVIALIVALHTNWQMTLATLAFLPLFFISSHFLGPLAARRSNELQRQLGQTTGTLQENLGAQPVIKAFGLEQYAIDGFTRNLDRVFGATLKLQFLMGIYGWAVSATYTAINLFMLALGAWMVVHGLMTAGLLVQFLGLMNQIIGPVHGFAGMIQGLQQAAGSMDRVEELLTAEPEIKDGSSARPLQPVARSIDFENLSFGYTEGEPILRHVSVSVPAGSSAALVGGSGSGKSTMLNLIMRFYDPDEGRLSFDGTDIREGTIESLRAQMGVVFQDNILFNTSLRENIRLGNLEATDAQVVQAAQMAEIHDYIMGLPDEYDTMVGERGARLSGGQRQRVAIARAILRNPGILLLDEATSALDPVTEAAINETLHRVGRGRTTVTVTHRLAGIRHVDQIHVLDRGEIVESGTHNELLHRGGRYAELWEEQGGGMGDVLAPEETVELGFLRRVPIFAGLDPHLLASLATRFSIERFQPGETIVTRGDPADRLYIVQSGQVDVLGADPARGDTPLAILREGEHFGEIALLHDSQRNATVRARLPVVLCSLSRAEFGRLLASVPQLRDALEAIIAGRDRLGAARAGATMVQAPAQRDGSRP